ncbi:MAG: hypothetical protein OEY89_02315 [Gammaproteobacteria bacterium]|nr:hypothetical protein [Gammaproteobacteria bacterium]
MTEQDKEQAFLEKTRDILDHGVDELETATANELRMIRQKALQPRRQDWFRLPGIPVFVTSAAVLVITVSLMLTQGTQPIDMPELEYLSLLSETEELDFYQDLEFYDWLDEERAKG